MKPLIKGLGLACATLTIGVATPAAAEEIVPPGNSAATQYTEAYPTGGGEKDALKGKGKGEGNAPKKVLGKDNVKRLREHGETGEDVAELAAETAPAPIGARPEPTAPASERSDGAGDGAGPSGSGNGGGAHHRQAQPASAPTARAVGDVIVVAQPEGSSAVGQIAGQALGAPSSGRLGLLLPLALLAALIWAVLYRRRGDEEA